MAKQAATSKKASKKPVSRTTTAKPPAQPVAASKAVVTEKTAPAIAPTPTSFSARLSRVLSPEALVAEAVGTFVLVVVALTTTSVLAPLYVGFTLVVLALIIGAISGSHVNPAVTFGLWTARKFPGLAVPFYWIAQFLGALAAIVVMTALTGKNISLNFNSFLSFEWGVFTIEVIGTAIFLFGVTAALSRVDLSSLGRAFGVGMSLFIGLAISVGLYTSLTSSINKDEITSIEKVPRLLRLDGPALNPAVALGAREKTDAQLQGSSGDSDTAAASRLTLGETIVGTLLGAALGANLYRVLSRNKQQ